MNRHRVTINYQKQHSFLLITCLPTKHAVLVEVVAKLEHTEGIQVQVAEVAQAYVFLAAEMIGLGKSNVRSIKISCTQNFQALLTIAINCSYPCVTILILLHASTRDRLTFIIKRGVSVIVSEIQLYSPPKIHHMSQSVSFFSLTFVKSASYLKQKF